MAAIGHFGWPKITFDRISRHFRSIRNFDFFPQNGCRRPFWMTENHFRSHFSPFQINTQLWFFFHKMAAGGHFGWPKITFDRISRHFRSILFFYFFWFLILDDRKSLSITFLAISDQYAILIFFLIFTKWLPAAILDDRKSPSIAFLAISDQYATFLFTKWLPAAILDDRKSLLIAFLAIFSSAVPPGSGAFQMPTCPSSSASASASASTLRGGRANLRNASVTFSLFLHEASLGWH